MRRSGPGSGGGHGSRNVKHISAPKTEPRTHSINLDALAQIGTSEFRSKLPLREGKGYEPPYGITDPVKAVGVGGGRKVYASGGQGCHGKVDPGVPSGIPSTKGSWPDD
jgi:hypothetical protein